LSVGPLRFYQSRSDVLSTFRARRRPIRAGCGSTSTSARSGGRLRTRRCGCASCCRASRRRWSRRRCCAVAAAPDGCGCTARCAWSAGSVSLTAEDEASAAALVHFIDRLGRAVARRSGQPGAGMGSATTGPAGRWATSCGCWSCWPSTWAPSSTRTRRPGRRCGARVTRCPWRVRVGRRAGDPARPRGMGLRAQAVELSVAELRSRVGPEMPALTLLGATPERGALVAGDGGRRGGSRGT
jgi:hypothetical protein